jgi:UDP-glucuronate 4-epimerase
MKVLVTGCAGFIGMHVSQLLLRRGDEVVGIDNLNDYYDPQLKLARLEQLKPFRNFKFIKGDISDSILIEETFAREKPHRVINLAAQAGVRYSLINPNAYVQSNLVGFGNILEGCRNHNVEHLVYASSSSVYGANREIPFSEVHNVDHPVSLYAATKKANELMAHSYSHLYSLPTTGLRYFTVYGPWGRPDMSPWIFTSAAYENRPIDVYNMGKMKRDFTYIDDVVSGTINVLDNLPKGEKIRSFENNQEMNNTSYRIYNIGNNEPIELISFIETIEELTSKKIVKNYLPMQDGDVPVTYADISRIKNEIGFNPSKKIRDGLENFIEWYRIFKKVN